MRVILPGLLVAVLVALLLAVIAPRDPTPSIPKPCVCPFKSPTACAIYCGIYAAPRAHVLERRR